MGCNPVSMVDPLGLQFFGPQTPMTVQDPAALARFMAPTLLKHMPGGGLWDLSNMNRYITQLPKELRAEAWMMYLFGGAIGGSTFQSKLGDLLQERAAKGNDRKGSWASEMFVQSVYEIENGYEISFDQDVLNTTVVHGVNINKEFFGRWERWLKRQGLDGLNSGDLGNINSGAGYVAGAVAEKAGKILVRNYNGYNKMSVIKTGKYFPYNLKVASSTLKTTSTVMKGVSLTAGGAGILLTGYQYKSGQISGTEALVDGIMGVAGFWFPGISIIYFGGKALYEYSTGNTLFEKPGGQ